MHEKLEKTRLEPFGDRPSTLLVRHSFSNSDMFGLFSRVIVLNSVRDMLLTSQLSRILWGCESILLSIAHVLSERRVVPDVDRQSSRHHDFTGGKEDI